MLPKLLKNFNLYVDGRGYAGRIEELTLPKLTIKTEEFQGGGMSGPVEMDLGMEKLELSLTFAEYEPELFRLFGLTNGAEIAFTIRGGLEGPANAVGLPGIGSIVPGLGGLIPGGSNVIPIAINVRGYIKEFDFDSWKPATKTALKCAVACDYYRLSINGIELIEIDPINMIRNVNGYDQLYGMRMALGI